MKISITGKGGTWHSAILILTIVLASCQSRQPAEQVVETAPVPKEVLRSDLQPLFDTSGLTGSILVYDLQEQIYYSNNFERCRKGFPPASTFKIPNSIIALETGMVEDDSTLFKWNGEKRRLPSWEKDLIFREAFHASCVPCYQEIARKIGVVQMKNYLDQFQYGNMVFDSSTIDLFWLEGASAITSFQQVDFLVKFYSAQLGISARTEKIMKRLMVVDENNRYRLSGKTGWAIRNEQNIGWYVGYLEKNGKVYFFATNVVPSEAFNMDLFPKIRSAITLNAFALLGIIEPAD